MIWQDGKYQKVDGIFCEIIKRHKNIAQVKIKGEIKYIFNEDGVYSHGDTIKQAYRDWLFKTTDRDISKYKNLKLNDIKDVNYWYECYRSITGACAFGTEQFIKEKQPKNKMSLKEILEITKGQYGYKSFKSFFEGLSCRN